MPPAGSECDRLRVALAPSGCHHAYRRDADGCPVPTLQCENFNCGPNEEVKKRLIKKEKVIMNLILVRTLLKQKLIIKELATSHSSG